MSNDITYTEFFPVSLNFLARQKALNSNYLYKLLTNKIIHSQAKNIVQGKGKKNIRFSLVDSAAKWNDIRELRLMAYKKTIPYMLNVIKNDGSDHYDSRSLVFGAWYKDKAVATIRFTVWPFELCEFIENNSSKSSISLQKYSKHLELSRLLVSPYTPLKGVMTALIIYSGLNICLHTNYAGYIGFVKEKVFNKLNKFMCSNTNYQFSIPSRGDHTYQLIQGDFSIDFENFINRKLPGSLNLGRWLSSIFFDKEQK